MENMIDYRIHVESTRNYTMPSSKDKAIPHNSKCRYGERGAADAKPKAQIILESYRAFWQRRCRAAAAGAVLEPLGGTCAVLPMMYRTCSSAAGTVLFVLRDSL